MLWGRNDIFGKMSVPLYSRHLKLERCARRNLGCAFRIPLIPWALAYYHRSSVVTSEG